MAPLGLAALVASCHGGPTQAQQADGLYLRANSEYLKGDFDKALSDFEQVRSLNPKDPRVFAAVGEVHLSQGKLNEALVDFKAARDQQPRRAANWTCIGFIEAQLGQTEQAWQDLQRALALNPRDFNAHEALARLQLRAGHSLEARDQFRAAALNAPKAERSSLWMEAAKAAEQQDAGDAIAVLAQAVADAPDAPLYTELGNLLVRQGRLPEAEAAYRKAAPLDPKDPTLWELVGEIDFKLGHLRQAKEAFARSLAEKDRSVVHVALARIALREHDRGRAQTELNRALQTASGEEARESRELAELLLEMNRPKDALKLLEELAQEADGVNDVALQRQTARLAAKLGDLQTRRAACERLRAAGAPPPCP